MRRLLSTALQEAFPDQDALGTFLFEYLEARYTLAQLGGQYAKIGTLVRTLIETAEARDQVPQVVAAARATNPTNTALVRAAHALGISPSSALGPGFEVLINEAAGFMDVSVFLARLGEIEGRVGRIEYEDGGKPVAVGTAFLVAPELVLTNFHVVEQVRRRGVDLKACRVRFDHRVLPDGKTLNAGRTVSFAPSSAVVDESPVSPLDTEPLPGSDPAPDHLDYALVRLAEAIGELPLGPESVTEGPPRGWITVPAEPAAPADASPAPGVMPGSPLWIMQHPSGAPLKLAFAEAGVESVNGNGTRVRHRVNTLPGSSGSPCFDRELRVVAMHHYGEKHAAPRFNQAVPITAIRDRLHANGHSTALA